MFLDYLPLFIAVFYIIIAFAIYIGDGWFDYFSGNNTYKEYKKYDGFEMFLCCIYWPIWTICKLSSMAKNRLAGLKTKHIRNKEQKNKIRIAEEKQRIILLQEANEEVENDLIQRKMM